MSATEIVAPKVRARIGVRVPVFKNAAVFVVYLTERQYDEALSHFESLKGVLALAGQSTAASRLVFERS